MGSETYRRRGMRHVPGPEGATVTLHADGSVSCALSFPSQGQGHATTVAQLVGEQLGVPLERVMVTQPDTDSSPAGSGTFASRGAVAQSGAARCAAAALPEGLEPGLKATRFFDQPAATFSGAVHVAAVEVDPGTGRVAVRAYVVVEDCGPLINPMIVAGQIHGAVAQGIGEALGERLVYDDAGQPQSGTLVLADLSGVSFHGPVLPGDVVSHVATLETSSAAVAVLTVGFIVYLLMNRSGSANL